MLSSLIELLEGKLRGASFSELADWNDHTFCSGESGRLRRVASMGKGVSHSFLLPCCSWSSAAGFLRPSVLFPSTSIGMRRVWYCSTKGVCHRTPGSSIQEGFMCIGAFFLSRGDSSLCGHGCHCSCSIKRSGYRQILLFDSSPSRSASSLRLYPSFPAATASCSRKTSSSLPPSCHRHDLAISSPNTSKHLKGNAPPTIPTLAAHTIVIPSPDARRSAGVRKICKSRTRQFSR